MINLAGRSDAEQFVLKELREAGIPTVIDEERLKCEVSVPFAGQYGSFWFERAWYYWMVSGKVPLEVAKQLYKDPVGRKDVRVAGHCGCPPPEGWVRWFDNESRQLIGIKEAKQIKKLFKEKDNPIPETYRVVHKKDFRKVGKPFVTSYHIDSQEGLNLFINTLKRNNVT